jgi:hypothetical protein
MFKCLLKIYQNFQLQKPAGFCFAGAMAIFKNSRQLPILMKLDNMIMLHYYNKIVIGKYESKNAEMITLSDALHMTKLPSKNVKESKLERASSFTLNNIRWLDDFLNVDNGFKYMAVKGKSSWTEKGAKIYTSPNTILSILEFYKLDSIVDYLKK